MNVKKSIIREGIQIDVALQITTSSRGLSPTWIELYYKSLEFVISGCKSSFSDASAKR